MSIITTERLTKILSETQSVITQCNSRGVHGSVEVNARMFENVLMELLRHRAAMLQGVENAETPTTMQTAPALDSSPKIAESPTGINQGKSEPVTTANKLPFEQWLSQQTGTIDVECGCVMTEVFFHWLRVAYEAGNSPVIPDGYCIMPLKLTADNGAKGALCGEFHVEYRIVCQACVGEGCEDCNHTGGWNAEIPVGWGTIKRIHEAAVEACALPAAPQQEVK
ncbi:hypothetical protein [Enterobacter hormaechei]|uniref:hypothetical protein n=1 Tax=Enterobacter hormaechei TaxID=158836 RepID=UPI002D767084|nr:hypothetical protein [Enterobacter hormaechei]WRS84090.1 hypothetical protein VCT43_11945 [Enterobacter hormaechei]